MNFKYHSQFVLYIFKNKITFIILNNNYLFLWSLALLSKNSYFRKSLLKVYLGFCIPRGQVTLQQLIKAWIDYFNSFSNSWRRFAHPAQPGTSLIKTWKVMFLNKITIFERSNWSQKDKLSGTTITENLISLSR